LAPRAPSFRIGLLLNSARKPHRRRGEPPPLQMLAAAGYAGGATDPSNFVVVSPRQRTALVAVSPAMLRFPYHTRYELIEFAVFTLAARAQRLVALHAACVGRSGRGLLLMGPTGAGKSTVTLQCLLKGFDMMSEDSVFVAPAQMLATGVANFLHVQAESLRWLEGTKQAAAIRRSPTIRRRSGAVKFEVDLRGGQYRLAARPQKIAAVVFLSPQPAGRGPLLEALSRSDVSRRLAAHQAYALHQPGWKVFAQRASRLPAFELRRGSHPVDAVGPLRALLES
jgi:hypothetical protein